MSSGPLYEKTVYVDPDIAGDFAAWLDEHLVEGRTFAGVLSVGASEIEAAPDGRAGYAWRYAFDSDEALDVFLEREANETYPGARQTFGDAIELTSRVLREDHAYTTDDGLTTCLNCGAKLRGQYCGNCGQRARSRLISLWELIRDAFGDLFELDSRLWRTITPLLIRPGLLTADYLAGRRARYMPPFRMYLVLSLVFFLVAFFNPREELALLYAPDQGGNAVEQTASGDDASEEASSDADDAASEESDSQSLGDEIRNDVMEDLEEAGVGVEDGDDDDGIRVSINGQDIDEIEDEEGCELGDYDVSNMPEWFRVRFSRERVEAACTRAFISEEGRQEFLRKMLDNIPIALFILLPLMAFVQAFLYPLSRRYYVEHLLFFVHFHAFFFLILSMQVLWGRLIESFNGPTWLGVLPIVATSFYIPIYLFKAMRRVYEQGWFLTFLKYVMLLVAYAFGFSIMMFFAFLIALAGS